eukprot:5858541-Amphidinium_carterae.1
MSAHEHAEHTEKTFQDLRWSPTACFANHFVSFACVSYSIVPKCLMFSESDTGAVCQLLAVVASTTQEKRWVVVLVDCLGFWCYVGVLSAAVLLWMAFAPL